MKVQEIMERAGISQTGRAIAYIKDGLDEPDEIKFYTNIILNKHCLCNKFVSSFNCPYCASSE